MESIETKQDLKYAVLSQLSKGKSKAVPGKILAQRLGLRDTRPIRSAVIELLKDKIPILGTSKNGYWISDNLEECNEQREKMMKFLRAYAYHHKLILHASYEHFSGQVGMKLE